MSHGNEDQRQKGIRLHSALFPAGNQHYSNEESQLYLLLPFVRLERVRKGYAEIC